MIKILILCYRFRLRCGVSSMIKPKKGKGSKELADLHEKQLVLLHQINTWWWAQFIHTPHAANMVVESTAIDENGLPRSEMAENFPILFPPSLPVQVRSLSEMAQVCKTEKKLRIAQAEDVLIEVRRQRQIVQGLWQFKRINMWGTGNWPNTKMLTLYKWINHKIEQAAQKYRTAHSALLLLNPTGTWKDCYRDLRREDICGPGKDANDTKTTNGRFEPSWIWLVPQASNSSTQTKNEFKESIWVEWAKTRARSMRWSEEFDIVKEEMWRVLAWFEWRVNWWENLALIRQDGNPKILDGSSAYAFKQANIARHMAAHCAAAWLPELNKNGIQLDWAGSYTFLMKRRNSQNGWNQRIFYLKLYGKMTILWILRRCHQMQRTMMMMTLLMTLNLRIDM